MSSVQRLSRRSFFKAGTSLAGLLVIPSSLKSAVPNEVSIQAQPKEAAYKYPNAGKIAIVYHPGAVLGTNNVDFNVVQTMFDQGIMQFTGITSSPANALASLFPGLTTAKKIAIKPNLLNSSVPTRKELVKAVITRLVQMLGGYPAANITLYERHSFSSVGYTTSYFGQNVKLVVDSSFPDLGYYMYSNGRNRPYSKSLYEADYLINMPVLKDHSCSNSFNFTLAFKNHMGTVNPGGALGIHCDKIACFDIMADSVMTTKQRIVIMDGLYAVYNGGPGGAPQATPKKIFISQDPVTNDYQGRKVLNELRVANGLQTNAGTYIEEAAALPYEIGIANPQLMNVLTINLPVELRLFHAVRDGDSIILRWMTEKETNNAGFDIERSVTGESDWTKIGFIKGSGSTTRQIEYNFVDRIDGDVKESASLFYRLKQIDFDGKAEYSFVVEVSLLPQGSSWTLQQNYPNPFNGITELPVELPRASALHVEVLDANGKVIEVVHDAWMNAGLRFLQWDASRFTTGVYTCRATAEGITREVRMILIK